MAKTVRADVTIPEDVRIARKAFLRFKGRSDRKTNKRKAVLESMQEASW